MEQSKFSQIAAWTVGEGLAGHLETAILDGFCERAVAMGLPLANAQVIIDTLHPIHEGHAFRWERGQKPRRRSPNMAARNEGEAAECWRTSPYYRLLQSGKTSHALAADRRSRRRIPVLAKSRASGMTDFVAIINRFAAGRRRSARWIASIPPGRPTVREASATATSRRSSGCCPSWRWRSNAPRSPASPRPWSRPISAATPAGGCSSGRIAPRRRRPDRRGAVVQRSAQLHPHHRHLAARADHPAAQRLRRRHHLGDPRARRRRAEADRRRRAGDLPGRRSRAAPAPLALAAAARRAQGDCRSQ